MERDGERRPDGARGGGGKPADPGTGGERSGEPGSAGERAGSVAGTGRGAGDAAGVVAAGGDRVGAPDGGAGHDDHVRRLPSMQRGLGLTVAGRQWVVTAYTLALAGLLLLGGRLADRLGARRT